MLTMLSQCSEQSLRVDLPLQGMIWRFVVSHILSDFQPSPLIRVIRVAGRMISKEWIPLKIFRA